MIDFSKCPICYWDEKTKISHLQRRVLIYSIAYYEMDENIVSDSVYDGICKQLVRMQKEFPDSFKKSRYYYVFYDFEGSTAFDLVARLKKEEKEYLYKITRYIISLKGESKIWR